MPDEWDKKINMQYYVVGLSITAVSVFLFITGKRLYGQYFVKNQKVSLDRKKNDANTAMVCVVMEKYYNKSITSKEAFDDILSQFEKL